MKKFIIWLVFCNFSNQIMAQCLGDQILTYSTYIGGIDYDLSRDIAVDHEGNIYITGGTSSDDFPTTPDAHNLIYNNAGSPTVGNWGPMMVFVSKFSPNGDLIWSTYIGGPSYDRAYGIEVDTAGYVYIGGRAGEGYPTTSGAFQETFRTGGIFNNLYGHQNGFITKLSPDGSEIVWSTLYGSDSYGFFRDIDIDDQGNVYGILNAVRSEPDGISADAFETDRPGGYDMVAAKFSADGSSVLWATFLGGSGEDRGGPAIRVASDYSVYVGGTTKSWNFPTTPGALQTEKLGPSDFFVSRISTDGTSLIYSTLLGGNGTESSETHSLFIDQYDQAIVACATNSTDIPTTEGVIKPNKSDPNDYDFLLAKLSDDGQNLVACSYFGGSELDYPEGLHVDSLGNLYVGGGTLSADIATSSDAQNFNLIGIKDGFILKLDSTFSSIIYGSYFGGTDEESIRALTADGNGSIYVAGQIYSVDLGVTSDAFQSNIASTNSSDCFMAKLKIYSVDDDLDGDGFVYEEDCNDLDSLINPNIVEIPNNDIDEDCDGMDLVTSVNESQLSKVRIFPNPVHENINIKVDGILNYKICLHDINGRILMTSNNSVNIEMTDFPSSIYFLEIINIDNGNRIIKKIIR